MKILMVNDYKEPIGGAEVYMYGLKAGLESQGHSVEVYSTDISKKEYIKRATTVSVLTYINRIFNVTSFINFRTLLKNFQPDVIHIHSYYELSPAFLFWTKDIRVLMTIHDQRIRSAVIDTKCSFGKAHDNMCPGCLECVGFKGVAFEKLKNLVHRLFTQKIKLYLIPSKFLFQQLKHYPDLQPAKQLYNGFSLPPFKPVPHKQHIVYAGRLVESKGVQYAIGAMPQIITKFPRARLDVIGSGDYESELKKLVHQLNLTNVVQFYGSLPHEKTLQYIYKADIVVAPSAYADNLPTVCIEAIAAGRPVVASNVGGLPEIVENDKNGFLVPYKNPTQLARRIIQLLTNATLIDSYGKNANIKSREFEMKKHLQSIVTIYTTLCR